jgi:hypothetical protein
VEQVLDNRLQVLSQGQVPRLSRLPTLGCVRSRCTQYQPAKDEPARWPAFDVICYLMILPASVVRSRANPMGWVGSEDASRLELRTGPGRACARPLSISMATAHQGLPARADTHQQTQQATHLDHLALQFEPLAGRVILLSRPKGTSPPSSLVAGRTSTDSAHAGRSFKVFFGRWADRYNTRQPCFHHVVPARSLVETGIVTHSSDST